MVSLIGIIIALVLLVILAMKGHNLLLIAPVLAIVVALFSGMNIVETLSGPYMQSFARYATNYFLIFMFGSVFGKLMEESGAARVIAESIVKITGDKSKYAAVMTVMVITALLTYGGVSLFVVIFAVMPISRPLFKRLDVPWPLFLAALFTGAATFTMTMLPGTPAIQNVIPTNYLGTTLTAAPVIGIVATIVVIAFNSWWMKHELNRFEKLGIGYEQSKGKVGAQEESAASLDESQEVKGPNVILALVPPVALLIILNIIKVPLVGTLALTCLISLVLFWKFIGDPVKVLSTGAANVSGPILNTCAVVGFGGVVGASAGYEFVVSALTSIPGPPIISWVIGINLLAGITGSASGGLAIGMDTLTPHYLNLVNPEVLHRLASISSGGLDSLPHNGVVVTGITVAGLDHKTGYKPIGMTCCVGPLITTVVAIILSTILY